MSAEEFQPSAAESQAIAEGVDALLVLSFGGPESIAEVKPFLERVTAGRGVPPARLNAVAAQYAELGGVSPLNAQNRDLLNRLRRIAPSHWRGDEIYLGNRNAEPFLADTLAKMADHGIRRACVFITSAFSSYSGCRQYREDLAVALEKSGAPVELVLLPRFHDHRLLSDIWSDRIRVVWPGDDSYLVFVTHSLPVAGSSAYVSQHQSLARSIVQNLSRSGIDPHWELAYQSRSGSLAQAWLEPDINDVIRDLAEAVRADEVGATDGSPSRRVVVAPIGFCAENMEIKWDLDHVAATTASEENMYYVRVEPPQSDPRFVEMISQLWSAARGSICSGDCCPNPTGYKPAVGD